MPGMPESTFEGIQGPAVCLTQFLRDTPPFDALESLAVWAAGLGYRGVQLPAWDKRCIDLDHAAESDAYCDDLRDLLDRKGLVITELGAFLAGQVLAFHSVYEIMFQPFYPSGLGEDERTEWATREIIKTIRASERLGTNVIPALSGGLAWPFMYPWPQRPGGLIEQAFEELARRWRPVLDAAAEAGVYIAFELHPGSDVFDGSTFERFLDATNGHPAVAVNYDPSHFVLQQLDYLDFIRRYGDRIRGFHVKDAEFRGDGRVGVYGGYESWSGRAGRFRTPGDGQVDFSRVFTLLTEAGFRGWAVLEWECTVKSPEQGAREGAPFIRKHLIEATTVAFDDFVKGQTDTERNRLILGLTR